MKKFLLAGVALSALVAGPAMAADLPVRAPAYKSPPPIITYYSWTGCYIGGHVGGLWVSKDWSDGDPLSPIYGQNIGSHDANGWLGGAQVGCNYQVGGWVFGIQGDYAWTGASGSSADLVNVGGSISSKVKGLSSVTGRVGYAWDRFLGYVKGGGAWEQDDYTATAFGFIGTASQTRSGWTVGIGGEYAFTNNLSGFVEYDWYGFGTKSATFTDQFGGLYGIADIKENKSVLKIGLNWKFGKGPVVANY
jgi:outer membrane immunogenic protein